MSSTGKQTEWLCKCKFIFQSTLSSRRRRGCLNSLMATEDVRKAFKTTYRIARFPHPSQARRAIPAPVAVELIWIIFRFAIYFWNGMVIQAKKVNQNTFERNNIPYLDYL